MSRCALVALVCFVCVAGIVVNQESFSSDKNLRYGTRQAGLVPSALLRSVGRLFGDFFAEVFEVVGRGRGGPLAEGLEAIGRTFRPALDSVAIPLRRAGEWARGVVRPFEEFLRSIHRGLTPILQEVAAYLLYNRKAFLSAAGATDAINEIVRWAKTQPEWAVKESSSLHVFEGSDAFVHQEALAELKDLHGRLGSVRVIDCLPSTESESIGWGNADWLDWSKRIRSVVVEQIGCPSTGLDRDEPLKTLTETERQFSDGADGTVIILGHTNDRGEILIPGTQTPVPGDFWRTLKNRSAIVLACSGEKILEKLRRGVAPKGSITSREIIRTLDRGNPADWRLNLLRTLSNYGSEDVGIVVVS